MHRKIFNILSQNPEYVKTLCNDRNNLFQFGSCKWYLYNYPQC